MVILIGSLMLNMFFVGALATRYALTGRLIQHTQLAETYINRYPESIRDNLKKELKERQPSLKEMVTGLRNARAELHAAFRAEPLERSKIQASMKHVRLQTEALIILLQEVVLKSVESVPYEVRQQIPDPELKFPMMRELGTGNNSTDRRP